MPLRNSSGSRRSNRIRKVIRIQMTRRIRAVTMKTKRIHRSLSLLIRNRRYESSSMPSRETVLSNEIRRWMHTRHTKMNMITTADALGDPTLIDIKF